MKIIFSILLLNLLVFHCYSQERDSTSQPVSNKLTIDSFTEINNNNIDSGSDLNDNSKSITTYNPLSSLTFYLSILILAFGLIVIFLEVYLIVSKRINTDYSIKIICVTLIIVSTLFLITAGYSNDQIAPAMGLLGTIAGYLLGKSTNHSNDE